MSSCRQLVLSFRQTPAPESVEEHGGEIDRLYRQATKLNGCGYLYETFARGAIYPPVQEKRRRDLTMSLAIGTFTQAGLCCAGRMNVGRLM